MDEKSTSAEQSLYLKNAGFKEYITIARLDHWFKNVFMLPGMLFAYLIYDITLEPNLLFKIIAGIMSTCLIASANYVINEFLDAQFDRFHPVKKERTAVKTVLNPAYVYLEWFLLVAVGLTIAYFINFPFLCMEAFLLFMGIMYNVKPFRTKDRVYLDVLSESVNNPIRLALGWFIFVPVLLLESNSRNFWSIIPPASIILAYWMGGAFLMATKRFAEYRFINNSQQAGLYRRSFKFYTEQNLLLSMFFYALTSAFFLGIFLVKHRIELLISFPFFALLFVWYLKIGLRKDSVVQGPEKLHHEKKFMFYVAMFTLLLMALLYIDIPFLHWFLNQSFQFSN